MTGATAAGAGGTAAAIVVPHAWVLSSKVFFSYLHENFSFFNNRKYSYLSFIYLFTNGYDDIIVKVTHRMAEKIAKFPSHSRFAALLSVVSVRGAVTLLCLSLCPYLFYLEDSNYFIAQ